MFLLSRRALKLRFCAPSYCRKFAIAALLLVVSVLGTLLPFRYAFANPGDKTARPAVPATLQESDWNTFFGANQEDSVTDVADFGDNASYYVGTSYSTWGSPIRAFTPGDDPEYPPSDAFVVKTDSTGQIVWNTFLGGKGRDAAYAVAVDAAGNLYVYGFSALGWGTPLSTHTPLVDVFVAKLSAEGQLLWLRFLGDTGDQYGGDMAADSTGNLYVVGYSRASWGTPIRPYTDSYPNALDGFVAALDAQGTLRWNTFLGGPGSDNSTAIGLYTGSNGIARLYVSGASNEPWGYETVYPDSNRVYVAFLRLDGTLVYNRFIPPPEGYADFREVSVDVTSLAVDRGGRPILGGEVFFRDQDDVNKVYCDGYLARTDSTLALEFLRTYTGTLQGPIQDVVVLPSGDFVTAGSTSCGLETPVSPMLGKNDGLLMVLDPDGAIFDRAYIGGPEDDALTSVASISATEVQVGGWSKGSWGSPVRPYNADLDGFGAFLGIDIPDKLYLPQLAKPTP